MSLQLPRTERSQIERLVVEINRDGYACIPSYLDSSDLKRMQAFVKTAIERSGNEYVHFTGTDHLEGSGLEEMAQAPEFKKLIFDLYEHGTGRKAVPESFYQVLRCLCGASGQKNSLIFHYDSYVVTALIPIHIPAEGRAGDLLMYPNTRKIRPAYLLNAMDKVLLDNPLAQRVLRACVGTKRFGPLRIKMKPGNLYFFWGYRSIHTNEPCDPDKVRATALFHYANPHAARAS